ncbi:MAG: flagellin [Tissierellia bacterium]|nr:flagellin [Tissierellia bacterium]
MRINNNLMAINTHRQLGVVNNAAAKSMEKLSSGYRINRAGDDAAGLSISEKMRAQIRGLNMASKNAQDGISLIQTAEGALDEVHSILQRMRELAVQAANDTNVEDDRQALQDEIEQLIKEIDRIALNTEFNTKKLLNGEIAITTSGTGSEATVNGEIAITTSGTGSEATVTGGLVIHIGANAGQNMTLGIDDMRSEKLGVNDINISTQSGADSAITTLDEAINKVSQQRSALGAVQNRLEHTIKNLDNAAENLQAAESRIRDVDMAKEMMELTRQNILQQAATAMLAQANMAPQTVLQLLR